MVTISRYSSLLEPVTQSLQAVQLNLLNVQNHVSNLLDVFLNHRGNANSFFKENVFDRVTEISEALNIDLAIPRICAKSVMRDNYPSSSVEDYFVKAIYIPYLDSLIGSLKTRFSDKNSPQFCLFALHPCNLAMLDRTSFKGKVDTIQSIYKIDNFENEAMCWFDMWIQKKDIADKNLGDMELIDLLSYSEFFPATRQALLIALTLPASTCTVERSFSTLRRVKTWLRSTMADDRLSGKIRILGMRFIYL